MTALQSSNLLSSSSLPCRRGNSIQATLNIPKQNHISFPKSNARNLIDELKIRNGFTTTTTTPTQTSTSGRDGEGAYSDSLVTRKLYAILESVSDRIETHANIGEQRNNWNNLLLTSINAITLSAAAMAGLALIGSSGTGSPVLALKLSSTLLYSAATGMLLVMNKIQPSQLAEEQRNAVRLLRQLQGQIQTMITLGSATHMDVKCAMKKVLALDEAFPLPLLGGVMLEKFPTTVKPAVWWPAQLIKVNGAKQSKQMGYSNGWNVKLEREMRNIAGVLERKDRKEYVRLSEMVLNVNKVLAILGPLLTGTAAIGSALVGHGSSWAAVFAILGGSLASVVNTMEHGGQVGMVFEMYRNCAGSFQLLQDSIESALGETDMEKRENGELFEMKVALQLGRSLSELRRLAEPTVDFASKLL